MQSRLRGYLNTNHESASSSIQMYSDYMEWLTELYPSDKQAIARLMDFSDESMEIENLIERYDIVEKILNDIDENILILDKNHPYQKMLKKKKDDIKIWLELYKLAIMQTALSQVTRDELDDTHENERSYLKSALYGFLLLGGAGIAFLEGMDGAQNILSLLPFAVPGFVTWIVGSSLFLVALGIFSAFEAKALAEDMGFDSAKNLSTALDIHHKQLEIVHQLTLRLAIPNDQKEMDIKPYESFLKLSQRFDRSLDNTYQKISCMKPESFGRKVVKGSLLTFGMGFSAVEGVFVASSFSLLALAGPAGLAVIILAAILGAAFFYIGYRKMIASKVTPTLEKKENFREKYKAYKKDNLTQGMETYLKEKIIQNKSNITIEAHETIISAQAKKISQHESIIQKQAEEIQQLRSQVALLTSPKLTEVTSLPPGTLFRPRIVKPASSNPNLNPNAAFMI